MCAWLLAITLDLFSTTFIAGARYTSSFLEWLRPGSLIVTDLIARRVLLAELGTIFVLRSFILSRMAGFCSETVSCGRGWRSHSDRWGA